MAITDIRQYVHLTAADIEELGRELDAIRADIEESRGEPDARYVHRTIQLQRGLAAGGRIALLASRNKVAWIAGTALTFWTILKLSVPNKLLQATSDDAPETHSELRFRIREGVRESFGVDPDTGRRRGLRTALRELQTGDVATA